MIKRVLVLFLISIPLLSNAQSKITLGNPYAVIDASEKYYFKKGSEIMTVKIDGKTVIIQKFSSSDLGFKKIKVYKDVLEKYTLEKVTKFQNKFYLFFSDWDKPNQTEQLYCREIDFDEGIFRGEKRKILQVKGKIAGFVRATGFWSFGATDKYDFYFSYDSARMLVQYRLKPEVKNDAKSFDVIGMNIFDNHIDLQWKEEIKMPYTEKKMNNLDYSIDSEGNAYILTTVYDDNTTDVKKSKNGTPNYHIELLTVKAATAKVQITPVKLTDKFISTVWLYEGPNNEMLCAGFYNKGKDLNDADGILLFKATKDGKISNIATYEIPLAVLNQYVSKRTQKKNEKKDDDDKAEFDELELREVLVEKDGSILLIGEQHFIKAHTYTNNGRSHTYYTYHYNDLLITKIDPSGKLAWMKKLPKRQTGRNGRGGMSYCYIRSADSHCFLFLDNENNRNLPVNAVPAGHTDGKGGFLTAYKVNNINGDVKKDYILDTRNVEGIELRQFLTSRIIPVSSKQFVFESYKKKKEDVMIKVEI